MQFGSICDSLSNGIGPINSTVDFIEIYPNPFIDKLNLKLLFPLKTKLKILNGLGEEIYNKQLFESESIDFSNLPQGSYFLELVSEKGIQRTKVIKM